MILFTPPALHEKLSRNRYNYTIGYISTRNACSKNHCAALGLTGQRDALVLVVSEQTGRFPAALNGHPSPLRPAK
ncbi:hypothetical protein PC41400_17430 [Paenibacillus chitinolyticus]|uniref:Uncharacterized protein n=1 Tax=Paenibacillus chitinolyticus TaxID=79263 RepID=A0A410WYS8_9BACL|nr:hypothetical protein PC41400_17430 [Paenibacillus chitinolyticus]